MLDVEKLLGKAVRKFWNVRAEQHGRQGVKTGRKDAGSRAAVTAAKHADGFVQLVATILRDAGLSNFSIHIEGKLERTLPGYYRPSKEWDVVVTYGHQLVAVVEVKSQVGSFGNNFNNRVEEAVGNAADFWAAYAKGMFAPSARPWLGYVFMLEEHGRSSTPTKRITLNTFAVDEKFQCLSYQDRYTEVCTRLVRERLYDAACFLTSSEASGRRGVFAQPSPELSVNNFARSLHARAQACRAVKGE